MNSLLRWIAPIILAFVTTAGIRLVTDISTAHPFWERSSIINLKDFLTSIVSCYLLDFGARYLVKSSFRKEKGWPVFWEYMLSALLLFIGSTISLFAAHYVIDSPNYLVDFVIAYVVVIPIGLLYYTIIRNDEIKKEYAKQTLQFEKMKNKQLETELDLLKSQYHPHFLFNALNTVYFQVDEENKPAKQTLELLSDLLRYQLYDVNNKVFIKQEINYLESYIRFQKLRMSERLNLEAVFDARLHEQKVHPLLFQPLLENAFKYVGGEYWIKVHLTLEGNKIKFIVENAIDKMKQASSKKSGIGIENLRRRLELLYPGKHLLKIEQREDTFYVEEIIDPD